MHRPVSNSVAGLFGFGASMPASSKTCASALPPPSARRLLSPQPTTSKATSTSRIGRASYHRRGISVASAFVERGIERGHDFLFGRDEVALQMTATRTGMATTAERHAHAADVDLV